MVWAVGLFPGSFPDVVDPTDADAGRTDVSVDPARRKVQTPSGRLLTATATATATSLNCAPAGSPAAPTTTASARLRYQPTVPVPDLVSTKRSSDTPAVASDGDLGSRSCLAGRRSTLRSPGNSQLEPQFPADNSGSTDDAKLHFAKQSHLDLALSLSLSALCRA